MIFGSRFSPKLCQGVLDPHYCSVEHLLLGQDLTDSSFRGQAVNVNGDVTVSTSQTKWSPTTTSSLRFGGTTEDYITIPTLLDGASPSWTYDAWVYIIDGNNDGLFSFINSGSGDDFDFIIGWQANDKFDLGFSISGSGVTDHGSFDENVWHHVACEYSVDTGRFSLYGNGTRLHVSTSTYTPRFNGQYVNVGCRQNSDSSRTGYLDGYVQDARFTPGVLRYDAATYTVPTAQAPTG